MNADDLLDSLALIPVSTTVNSQLYGILSGTYAYVMTFFYSEKTLTARRTQVAMSYNTVPARMAVRLYGSNGWVDWQGLTNASELDKYLPKTGGEVTGRVTSRTGYANPIIVARSDKGSNDADWYQDLQFENADAIRVAAVRAMVNASGDRSMILGVSNKSNVAPTGLEIVRNEASNYVYVKAPVNNYPTVKQLSNTYAGTTALTAGTSALENNCVYQKYE